ncbi:MAG: HD-GYP domain-containing protein [Candidatus Sericytochromatia bacterium]|uniref:HD-GYP domain-containing protein n=1 Tax=Candidatus Tanganyikabacteria bacterium TaxID=2961651 RepID=A0A937X5G0_9BACT|nr:HD-GYP domain-containing protein [Candidatus Tanganyikabacteria bacterium]
MNTSIRTPIEKVRPGMVLAEPVFHPTTMQMLLSAGTPISHQNISLLLRSGVQTISVINFAPTKADGAAQTRQMPNMFKGGAPQANPGTGDYPGFGGMFKQEAAKGTPTVARALPRFSETRLEQVAKEVVTRNFQTIREVEAQFSYSAKIDFEKVDNCVQTTIREIILNKELLESLADLRIYDEYTYAHSANVMSFALLMGVTLGYNYEQLRTLGTGAMLHDVGKTLIPDFILHKPGKLTEAEFEVMRSHPDRGLKAIQSYKWAVPDVKAIVLHHHERFNGTGYPHGLKGRDIPEMARVVGLCDVYDALVAKRMYKAGIPPYQAYQIILNSMNVHFEARMVWAFQNFIVPYPKNCVVVLSSGDIAKVTQVNRDDPLRPVVEMENGQIVDLTKQGKLVVTDIYRPERHSEPAPLPFD